MSLDDSVIFRYGPYSAAAAAAAVSSTHRIKISTTVTNNNHFVLFTQGLSELFDFRTLSLSLTPHITHSTASHAKLYA